MKVHYYECDECGSKVRRITVHAKEFGEKLHFCGTKCMADHFADLTATHGNRELEYWLTGQDLRDGA